MNALKTAAHLKLDWQDEALLCIGIGNSGRGDDGLGWAFLERLENWTGFKGQCHYCYQLQVEDAALIAPCATVLFIDAARDRLPDGFGLFDCSPAIQFSFSTHELSPESILFLAADLYQKSPPAYVLAISGVDWELGQGLSHLGAAHLEKAWQSLTATADV
ncbi:MAG TPA: hydrogenase maturation protease [Saprospiraceae bacterium]|nr:hydrogenase maturation protease [Saprospiraceae bacterium]HMQ83709.1 hydrogenase maturation protease [Saprospiraceae bacterium]